MPDILAAAGALTIIAGGAAVVAQVGRVLKRLADAIDDWQGEPARPGVPGRPGVMERLAVIEAELHPNHGASLRDVVDRLEHGVRRIENQLAAHLEQHRQGEF